MNFRDALSLETGTLFEVSWYPDDFGLGRDPHKTYVVAPDFNAAANAVSSNLADIRSITRVHNGGCIVVQSGAQG